jgi:hypothetical protein
MFAQPAAARAVANAAAHSDCRRLATLIGLNCRKTSKNQLLTLHPRRGDRVQNRIVSFDRSPLKAE